MKISIELTKAQIESLAGLIDAGLRATGLRSAKVAGEIAEILQVALEKHEKDRPE